MPISNAQLVFTEFGKKLDEYHGPQFGSNLDTSWNGVLATIRPDTPPRV